MSSSSLDTCPGAVEGKSWEIFQRPLVYTRPNSRAGAVTPPEAVLYCPVLLSLACSWPETATMFWVPGALTRPGGSETVGSVARIVTAVPGRQASLAFLVRYCLATA